MQKTPPIMYPSKGKYDPGRLKTANYQSSSYQQWNVSQAKNHVHNSQSVQSAFDKHLQLHKEHTSAFLWQSMFPGKIPLHSSVKQ
jgi:hypothetical protein